MELRRNLLFVSLYLDFAKDNTKVKCLETAVQVFCSSLLGYNKFVLVVVPNTVLVSEKNETFRTELQF